MFSREFFAMVIGLCSITGCHSTSTTPAHYYETLTDSMMLQIKSGDVVFRLGNDYTSQSLAYLNRHDKSYSHCGIVLVENNQAYVYHCIGTGDNPNLRMRKDALKTFFNSKNNFSIAAFRYPFNDTQQAQLRQNVLQYYQARPPFDFQFDIQSDSTLYCAEMVAKAINKAYNKKVVEVSLLNGKAYYSVDNLFVNDSAREVFSFRFN